MESKTIEKLITNYKNNCLSHAILFETNDIMESHLDLLSLVKEMLCDVPECKDRKKCETLIDENNFPELVIIEPENDVIKKEDVQSLMSNFELKPEFSNKKIFIIISAEKMNGFAANSILKFLEEPQENIYGFLITNNKSNVMATIKSRCQFQKIIYEESFYKRNIMTEDQYIVLNNEVEVIIDLVIKKDISKLFLYKKRLIEVINTKEGLVKLLKIIKNYYYSSLFNQQDEVIKSKNILELINYNKQDKILIGIIQLIDSIIDKCHYNINFELMIDNFFIEMVGIYE